MPCAAMHVRQGGRTERREAIDDRLAVCEMGPRIGKPHRRREAEAEGVARLDEVAFDDRLHAKTALGEDVSREKRARGGVKQIAGLPSVRDVGCVDPDEVTPTDGEMLAVGHGPGW